MQNHFEVLIIGGGTAGLTVAAQLATRPQPPQIGLIEPSPTHYYQPLGPSSAAPGAIYDGYTSCPVVTGRGKLIMAEFDYDENPVESFPFDQRQERFSMYALKASALPQMYWHGMRRGRV